MNDADKKLIDAWREWPTQFDTLELLDVLAAFDRALADTPTLVETGRSWCVTHAQTWARCRAGDTTCDLRPLVYVEAKP